MNRRQFWLMPYVWPKDTSEWVFLGRAILRIGAAVFPESWRNDDPSRGAAPVPRPKRQENDPKEPENDLKEGLESIQRAQWVFTQIAAHCRSGKIGSGVRPVAGGDITILEPTAWATESHRLTDRLAFCQLRISAPFAYGPGGIGPGAEEGMGYIFLKRSDFEPLMWLTPAENSVNASEDVQSLMYWFARTVPSTAVESGEESNAATVDRSASRQPSAEKLELWYTRRVATWPADQRSPSWEDDQEAATQHFSLNVTRDAIRALRRNHAPKTWSAKGRKRKTRRA